MKTKMSLKLQEKKINNVFSYKDKNHVLIVVRIKSCPNSCENKNVLEIMLIKSRDHCLILANKNRGFHRGYDITYAFETRWIRLYPLPIRRMWWKCLVCISIILSSTFVIRQVWVVRFYFFKSFCCTY